MKLFWKPVWLGQSSVLVNQTLKCVYTAFLQSAWQEYFSINDNITFNDEYLSSSMDPSEPTKPIRNQMYALIWNTQAVYEYSLVISPLFSKLNQITWIFVMFMSSSTHMMNNNQRSRLTDNFMYIIWLSPYNKDVVLSSQSTGTGPSQIIAVQAFC